MKKIETIKKARKDYKCTKCGKKISKGEPYVKGLRFRQAPIIRCTECGVAPYELSSSEYIQRVGRLVEEWETDYPIEEGFEQAILDELNEIRDFTEDSLENMPENLREGETGCMLQDRIDALEGAISEIESFESWTTYTDEIIDFMAEEADDEEADDEEYVPDENEVTEHLKEKYRDLMEEAFCGLEY